MLVHLPARAEVISLSPASDAAELAEEPAEAEPAKGSGGDWLARGEVMKVGVWELGVSGVAASGGGLGGGGGGGNSSSRGGGGGGWAPWGKRRKGAV